MKNKKQLDSREREQREKLSLDREEALVSKPIRSIQNSESKLRLNLENMDVLQLTKIICEYPHLKPMFDDRCKRLGPNDKKNLLEHFIELSKTEISVPEILLLIVMSKECFFTSEQIAKLESDRSLLKEGESSKIDKEEEYFEEGLPVDLNKIIAKTMESKTTGIPNSERAITREMASKFLGSLAYDLQCSDLEALHLFFRFCLLGGTTKGFKFQSSVEYLVNGKSRLCKKHRISRIWGHYFSTDDKNKDLKKLATVLSRDIGRFAEEIGRAHV